MDIADEHSESDARAAGAGTAPDSGAPARGGIYRQLVADMAWRRLTVTTGFLRIAVAMAPVALVLAGHAATGSFRTGALMASCYVFASGIAAPLSGRIIDRFELRKGVSAELAAGALILLVLAGLAAGRFPAVTLVVASTLAGATPTGAMGGLRAYLQRIIPPGLRERAFALDATLLEVEWMTAPALVAVTGYLGAPVLAVVLMALVTLGAFFGTRMLPPQPVTTRPAGAGGAWRMLSALPVYFLNAVMGYADGTLNIALAPMMHSVGTRAATAGLLISLVSATSAIGGIGYVTIFGRRPGGDLDSRANIALLALGIGLALMAFSPTLALLAIAAGVCGLWFAPVVAMRNIILGDLLPESMLSEGFSTLAAAGQAGYGMSGVAAGVLLGFTGARWCFALAAVLTIASALGALAWHRWRLARARRPGTP